MAFIRRTDDEICARITEKRKELLNFEPEVLLDFLPFDSAKPFLDKKFVEDSEAKKKWKKMTFDYTEEAVRKEMVRYMTFAWGKVENHRGISAGRSVQKMESFLWLLGDDETLQAMKAASYENYGAPMLAVICHKYDLPIPQNEAVQRMIRSERCGADYDCGCGEV